MTILITIELVAALYILLSSSLKWLRLISAACPSSKRTVYNMVGGTTTASVQLLPAALVRVDTMTASKSRAWPSTMYFAATRLPTRGTAAAIGTARLVTHLRHNGHDSAARPRRRRPWCSAIVLVHAAQTMCLHGS